MQKNNFETYFNDIKTENQKPSNKILQIEL